MVEVIDSNISYLPFPTFTGDGLAVRFDSNISYLSFPTFTGDGLAVHGFGPHLSFPTFTGDGLTVWDSSAFIVASLLRRRLESFKVALRTLL